MRKQLIRLLFFLLGYDFSLDKTDVNEEKRDKMLASLWVNPSFIEYVKARDVKILKAIGSNIDRDKYLEYIGARLELENLVEKSKKAYVKIKKQKG